MITANTPATTVTGKLDLAKATSYADVYRALEATRAQSKAVEAPLPNAIVLTEGEKDALTTFEKQASDLPQVLTRRALKTPELVAYNTFYASAKALAALADRVVEKTLKPVYHNHFDVIAENNNVVTASTFRHEKTGHYGLADDTSARVEGVAVYPAREIAGGAVKITVEGLQKLEEAGKITHAQFLRWTTSVRVVNEDGILADLKKTPELIEELAQVTTASAPTIKLSQKKIG